MKFLAGLTVLASIASATPFSQYKRDLKPRLNETTKGKNNQPIQANLIRGSGNTQVMISLKNSGDSAVKLFTPGTILDKAAVEKVAVYVNNTRLGFDGVRLRIAPQELLTEESFQTIKRGQTVEIPFDFGEMHDLGDGSVFDLLVDGGIPYAKAGTTQISGTIPVNSNTLRVKDVDAKKAALTRLAFHQNIKRSIVQSTCQGAQNTAVNRALINCNMLANKAAAAAVSNNDRMMEYFKDSSTEAKNNVSQVFKRVAGECRSRTQGVAKLYCSDVYKSCQPGVLAYTVPALNFMVNCPLYFSALPALSTNCHAQDQASTTLHEMTHLIQMKGTLDYGVYGYAASKSLPSNENLNHADTYCLFANAVNIGSTC